MRNLTYRWRSLWDPAMYHGWGKKKKYFEGWYFKIVDPTEEHAIAIIPGISMDKEGNRHSFIQVLDGSGVTSAYHRFEEKDFFPSQTEFKVRIGDNQFQTNGCNINLPNLKGNLKFENLTPWPASLGAPGVMGWYSFVPFMECYHGVVSLNHNIIGTLEINGKEVDFTGGKGYIEKDWGKSFPSAWIWMQSNHFNNTEDASLFCSVANIPWLGTHFVGFIAGLWLDGQLYKFTTYGGAQIKTALGDNTVFIGLKNNRYHLRIAAQKAAGAQLAAPSMGAMTGKVNESMQATIDIELLERGKRIYYGSAKNAGLEVSGIVKDLLSDDWVY
jgi:tocopherol cyclase